MSTRTAHTKGLHKPHEMLAPVPGHGNKSENAKSIDTEKAGHNPKVGAGLPSTYFGNSRGDVHKNFDKHPHD